MQAHDFPLASFGYAPIKGTRHEPRELRFFDARPGYDRRFALLDPATGRFLRTAAHGEKLIPVRTDFDGQALSVTLPGQATITAEAEPTWAVQRGDYWGRTINYRVCEGPFGQLFSDYLGFKVQLCRPETGGVIYGAPVSLVFTASLLALAQAAGEAGLTDEHARFRANFVLESPQAYIEDSLAGAIISAGGVSIRVGQPIPRCVVVNHNPVSGQRDSRALTALQRSRPASATRDPLFGVYGELLG